MDELVSMVPAAGVGGQRGVQAAAQAVGVGHGDEPAAGQRRHRHHVVRGQRIVFRQGDHAGGLTDPVHRQAAMLQRQAGHA